MEEECHRVEAQLALKEARLEIQQLSVAVDSVRARLSDADGVDVQNYFKDINAQNHKLENFLVNMELAQARLARDSEGCGSYVGGSAPASVSGESPGVPNAHVAGKLSCSCGNSPARSLTRSSTYTKLSEQTPHDRNGDGAQDSGFVCSGESIPSRAELLLEAAFLSEETASLLNSYTQTLSRSLPDSGPQTFPQTLPPSFSHPLCPSVPQRLPYSCTYPNPNRLAAGEQPVPFLCALAGTGCTSHPCLSHHHLCVHPLREMGIQTEGSSIATTGACSYDLDTIAEQRTFRSQACSPTSTWLSDEGEEELDSVTATTTTTTTATVLSTWAEPNLGTVPSLAHGAKEGMKEESDVENPGGKPKEYLDLQKQRDPADAPRLLDEETRTTSAGEHEATFWAESERSNMGFLKPSPEIQSQLPFEQCDNDGNQGETGESPERRQEEACLSAGRTQDSVASLEQAHTSQPRRSASAEAMVTVFQENSEEDEDRSSAATAGDPPGCDKIQRSYWSRHFWVDLLAVAIPMVPTVAWLCRSPARGAQPMYHFGSLLRGCCTVALHSLRRGGGLRHYPAGGGDLGGSII